MKEEVVAELKKKCYRLRKRDRIVGIMIKHKKAFKFKGNEFLWWILGMPKYNFVDEGVGLIDKYGDEIFELDIVEINDGVGEPNKRGIALWNGDCFGFYMIEEREFMPVQIDGISLFTRNELEIVGYLFENKKLSDRLGLNHLLH